MTEIEQGKLGRAVLGRRSVLHGAALTGVAVVLASCGDDDTSAGPTTSDTPSAGGSQSTGPSESPAPLTDANEVPVNGGVIIGEEVVVTQPEQGTFKAFSAICTHAGCVVHDVTDGVINCTCHGSQYSASDGSVLAGPAPSPLPEVPVEVKAGQVVRA